MIENQPLHKSAPRVVAHTLTVKSLCTFLIHLKLLTGSESPKHAQHFGLETIFLTEVCRHSKMYKIQNNYKNASEY